VAGRGRVARSPLLPEQLRALVREVPAGERVRLAGGEALRYRDMRLKDGPLTLTAYVLPTTTGSAVVACHAPAADSAVAATCERAAGTLRATSGDVVALGPSARYAKGVARTVRALDAVRTPARRQLAGADTAAAQARGAGRVATAFAAAARSLDRLDPPAGGDAAHRGMRAAFARARDAYAGMRRAATARSKARYARARGAVARAEDGVRGSLRALRRLGYRTA
jgi:hypothetical protein